MDKTLTMMDFGTTVTTSTPAQAAEAALENALAYCAEKMGLLGPQSVLDRLVTGDENAHGYFQYALARLAGEYLGSFDPEAMAAYLYHYEATADDLTFGEKQAVSLLHMIVVVRRKTEALSSLISAFDRGLADAFTGRAGLPRSAHLLDVQVVDQGEVKRGAGYGALLSSVHLAPLQVWAR